jgi:lipoate-protein ligase B
MLEQTIIGALSSFEISGERVAARPGVWVAGAKIAAIGVRVSRGVTTHGFALNVNTDLSWFSHIVPCGIADASVTSMQAIAGREFATSDVEDAIVAAFGRAFGVEFMPGEVAVVPDRYPRPAEEAIVGR